MGTVSIEQQIAELTPEQKNNMGRIYRNYIFPIISIVLTGILAGIEMFVEVGLNEKKYSYLKKI